MPRNPFARHDTGPVPPADVPVDPKDATTEPHARSPKVLHIKWGSIEVEGFGTFKDVLLTPGGARTWDWAATRTHHHPGILEPVIDLLVATGAKTLVLTQGVDGVLLVPDTTVAYAESLGLTVHVERTPGAISLYNDLAIEGPVAAAIHTTC